MEVWPLACIYNSSDDRIFFMIGDYSRDALVWRRSIARSFCALVWRRSVVRSCCACLYTLADLAGDYSRGALVWRHSIALVWRDYSRGARKQKYKDGPTEKS